MLEDPWALSVRHPHTPYSHALGQCTCSDNHSVRSLVPSHPDHARAASAEGRQRVRLDQCACARAQPLFVPQTVSLAKYARSATDHEREERQARASETKPLVPACPMEVAQHGSVWKCAFTVVVVAVLAPLSPGLDSSHHWPRSVVGPLRVPRPSEPPLSSSALSPVSLIGGAGPECRLVARDSF